MEQAVQNETTIPENVLRKSMTVAARNQRLYIFAWLVLLADHSCQNEQLLQILVDVAVDAPESITQTFFPAEVCVRNAKEHLDSSAKLRQAIEEEDYQTLYRLSDSGSDITWNFLDWNVGRCNSPMWLAVSKNRPRMILPLYTCGVRIDKQTRWKCVKWFDGFAEMNHSQMEQRDICDDTLISPYMMAIILEFQSCIAKMKTIPHCTEFVGDTIRDQRRRRWKDEREQRQEATREVQWHTKQIEAKCKDVSIGRAEAPKLEATVTRHKIQTAVDKQVVDAVLRFIQRHVPLKVFYSSLTSTVYTPPQPVTISNEEDWNNINKL